jgi:hypothetical protein
MAALFYIRFLPQRHEDIKVKRNFISKHKELKEKETWITIKKLCASYFICALVAKIVDGCTERTSVRRNEA